MGERTPHLDARARGGWIGLTAKHTRADLIRSVIEGVCYSQKDCLDIVEQLGVPVSSVRASGGGARSPFWRQILADVFGKRVDSSKARKARLMEPRFSPWSEPGSSRQFRKPAAQQSEKPTRSCPVPRNREHTRKDTKPTVPFIRPCDTYSLKSPGNAYPNFVLLVILSPALNQLPASASLLTVMAIIFSNGTSLFDSLSWSR